ncbi:hypothetical protein [Paraburkholderia ferrariae]|uniref:Glycine-rich domain-containing protein n=1 Tax=Paraburkholderia ferrariae TaxID=386056 RepID=A0ABU9RHX6_9BURK
MTIENDFLPFATAGGANVLTQAQYLALAQLSTGYQSGIANSAQMNKTWRQASIIAAMIAQFIVDNTGQPAIDDGTTATLEANLLTAVRNANKTGIILADSGAANAYTAVNVPPLVSGTWVDGVIQQVKIAHANTGASTYAPDGLTAIPIYGLGLAALQGGELFVGGTAVLMHATIPGVNSGNPIVVLMECAGGAQQVAPATQSQHAMQLQQKGLTLLQAYTTAGTNTPTVPAGVFKIYYEIWGGGAGGGGGSTSAQSGNAGGAGGFSKGWMTVTPGQTLTAIVGANGTGGANTGIGGTNGGSSSLTNGTQTVSCTGGAGGSGGGTGGGVGGSGSGGDFNASGGSGTGPSLVNSAGSLYYGPPGGAAYGVGASASGYGTGAGFVGRSPGAGGAGGAGGSAGAYTGGNGAAGAVYFWG